VRVLTATATGTQLSGTTNSASTNAGWTQLALPERSSSTTESAAHRMISVIATYAGDPGCPGATKTAIAAASAAATRPTPYQGFWHRHKPAHTRRDPIVR
jgi:hypothetical protein